MIIRVPMTAKNNRDIYIYIVINKQWYSRICDKHATNNVWYVVRLSRIGTHGNFNEKMVNHVTLGFQNLRELHVFKSNMCIAGDVTLKVSMFHLLNDCHDCHEELRGYKLYARIRLLTRGWKQGYWYTAWLEFIGSFPSWWRLPHYQSIPDEEGIISPLLCVTLWSFIIAMENHHLSQAVIKFP